MSISSIYRSSQPLEARVEPNSTPAEKPSADFAKLLQAESARPSFSAQSDRIQLSQHAETRIRSRAIPWNEHLEQRIAGGIAAAEAKGSREALILADEVAVIANVKSKTIITAMDRNQMKEKIFTNIDSAVLV